jgi:hypothetical protein
MSSITDPQKALTGNAAVAREMTQRLLTRCPMEINGKPKRRRDFFDTVYAFDAPFIAAVTAINEDRVSPILKHSRSLQDTEVESLLEALKEPGKQMQAPAGIPKYDYIGDGGSRLVRLARPKFQLETVDIRWSPPMPLRQTDEGTIYTSGHWVQDVTYSLIKIRLSRYEWSRLLASYQNPAPEIETKTRHLHAA